MASSGVFEESNGGKVVDGRTTKHRMDDKYGAHYKCILERLEKWVICKQNASERIRRQMTMDCL